jgi:hypothetical protein
MNTTGSEAPDTLDNNRRRKKFAAGGCPAALHMGDPRSHDSRYSRHGRILAFLSFVVNKKYAIPRTPEKYHQEEQLHFDL